MGNWNYSVGKATTYEIKYRDYVAHQVNLISRGKHSGITYDLRDAFLALEKDGLLTDSKKDGFTKEDALNLYKELDKIHKERKLDRNYTKMKKNSRFDYSEEDVRRLAEAAGYKTQKTLKMHHQEVTDHTGVAPKIPKSLTNVRNIRTNTPQNNSNNQKQENNSLSFWQKLFG